MLSKIAKGKIDRIFEDSYTDEIYQYLADRLSIRILNNALSPVTAHVKLQQISLLRIVAQLECIKADYAEGQETEGQEIVIIDN